VPKSVIAYDKDLPEIPGRRPWERPIQHLVKDESAPTGWRVADGRRDSRLLLVPKIRTAVDTWRDAGYPGASDVARRLFEYWFEEDHEIPGFGVPFRYYFCQREAIETLVWLVEVAGQRDAQKLIQAHATVFEKDLFSKNIMFQTTMKGQRQIVRYVPELDKEGVQDLPPEDLRRFAFKMATGSGKTWVVAMAVVWSRFHKLRVAGSELSTNFLIVTPNVIVYQRLEKDFGANRIFYELPLIPREWRGAFSQKIILRGDAAEPDPSGNLFLTNIHQLYESRDEEWTPQNAVDALLGQKPSKHLASSGQRSMLERGYWLRAAVARCKDHFKVYKQLQTRPVLFIMAEKNVYADAIGEYLWKTKEFGFKESEVLVIHTDAAGEITKKDLDVAREAARDIDKAESKIKAIVSVMMLREGWDVRNVTVVLGLRPFTAKAEILPEQVIGRGLRPMTEVSPDRTQTLEVLGTRNLLNVLRTQLDSDGVGVASTKSDPPPPVIVEPVKEHA
jgi:hypothetical protein